MPGKNQWDSRRPSGKWAVHGERNNRDTALYDTQAQANECAIEIAKNQKSEVIIQGRDGRIRSKDSYGNDPCPLVDKEH